MAESERGEALAALDRLARRFVAPKASIPYVIVKDAEEARADIETVRASLSSASHVTEGEPDAWLIEYEAEPGDWRYFGCRRDGVRDGECSPGGSQLRGRALVLRAASLPEPQR